VNAAPAKPIRRLVCPFPPISLMVCSFLILISLFDTN
jgi:hypothetical protein